MGNSNPLALWMVNNRIAPPGPWEVSPSSTRARSPSSGGSSTHCPTWRTISRSVNPDRAASSSMMSRSLSTFASACSPSREAAANSARGSVWNTCRMASGTGSARISVCNERRIEKIGGRCLRDDSCAQSSGNPRCTIDSISRSEQPPYGDRNTPTAPSSSWGSIRTRNTWLQSITS